MTSTEGFEARYAKAMESHTPIDPREIVSYNFERMAIEDIPSILARWMLGYGHDPVDVGKREHLRRPVGNWPYTPSTCLVASGSVGVWIDDNHLACPGCGLDFT